MNRKSFQLSLGSLFLATLMFAIGLFIGREFSRSREQDRVMIKALMERLRHLERERKRINDEELTKRIEAEIAPTLPNKCP